MFARSLLHLSPPHPPLLLLSTLDHSSSSSSSSSSHVISFDQVKINGFGFGLSDLRRLKLSSSIRLKAMEDSGRSVVQTMGSGSEDPDEISGTNGVVISTVGKATNIVWQECSVGKPERQKLLKQKGCVIWITGLSGSGKSTLACALSRGLHCRGKLTYILDGDNVRHGLNRDLSFEAEDRAENIRRIGEVAKLFADAGVICIASLISPYRRDRDACRAILPEGDFIEVFMNVPLDVCEARDAKGLYKLARAGKIKGFTGIDDPYEPPLNCEIEIGQQDGTCASPCTMAEQVISYLEEKGFLA